MSSEQVDTFGSRPQRVPEHPGHANSSRKLIDAVFAAAVACKSAAASSTAAAHEAAASCCCANSQLSTELHPALCTLLSAINNFVRDNSRVGNSNGARSHHQQQQQAGAASPPTPCNSLNHQQDSSPRQRTQQQAQRSAALGVAAGSVIKKKKQKMHSSMRARLRVADLTAKHQALLQQCSELAAAHSQLRQQEQQLSDAYDASLPHLLALQQQQQVQPHSSNTTQRKSDIAAAAAAMTALVDGKSGRVGLESSECCWRLIPGNSSSAAAAAELQLYSNLQLMLPLFEQLPAEQQQCVLAIAGSMYGNIVQQLQALLPELDPIFRNPTPLALTEQQQQQQQQDKLHQVPSLLQPELSMMPLAPVHQQQQVQQQQQHEDQSGSFVLPELSVLVASAQQQQPASQLNASDQAIYALPALQTELSVMPVLQHQQEQQPSGVLQPVLSTIPPHQLLLQQHCLDMYEQDEVTPAAAASTPAAVVPRLSVVASTTAAAAAAAAAATAGCVPPAVSVDPFSVAAAADWGPGMPQAMSVALPPAAAAAAAVVSAAASPGKRDRTAFRQQQQQEDNAYAAAELIRFMASSLSLSEEAPSPKQPKLAVSSSNKARNGSVTNAPWDAARSFSFSLQLPSGMSALSLSLPDLSGISSPLVAVGGSNGFTFGGSIEARTASAEAAPAAAAAAMDGSCATAMAVDGDTQRAAVHNGAAVAAAKAAGCTGLAMQQALALQHNLLLLTQLLTSGGPSVLFQVFGSSDSSTCSTDAAAIGAGGSPRADQLQEFQLMHQAACDDVQMMFPASAATAAEPGVAAAAAEAGAKAGVASCCGCSICRSAAVAPLGTDSSSFKQQQQQQDLLSGVRLSSSQRRVLQQLLDAAAANHASNYLHLQQQLSWLAAQADLRLPASIASCHAAPLCSAGVASWEAVQSLVEAVQAGCAADATVLQQVMSQAWGPQSPLSLVQQVRCLAAAHPYLPGYCLLQQLLEQPMQN